MSVSQHGVVLFAMVVTGCGAHSLDVGSNDAGSSDGASTSADLGLEAASEAAADPAAGQVWQGRFENYQLPNGSDALTMTLQVAVDGSVTGTLLLGDGSLLKPPSDPNIGYPPGAQFSSPLGTFVVGFRYTILDGILSGAHLTFRVAEFEVWTQWCALQTSYLQQSANDAGIDFYSCLPNPNWSVGLGPSGCSQRDPTTMVSAPLDCGKAELCDLPGRPCQCSATGCQVNPSPQPDISLDLLVAGAKADGTTGGGLGNHIVHFIRTQ